MEKAYVDSGMSTKKVTFKLDVKVDLKVDQNL